MLNSKDSLLQSFGFLAKAVQKLNAKVNALPAVGWNYYATVWGSAPSLAGVATISGQAGKVYSYTLQGVTRYRFVPDVYTSTLDAFYSNFTDGSLTGLICSRG